MNNTVFEPRVHGDRALFKRIFLETRPHWARITLHGLVSLLQTPLVLLTPIPLKIAVDSVVGTKPLPGFIDEVLPDALTATSGRTLVLAAVLQVAVLLFLQLQSMSSEILRTATGERLTLDFRARIFAHLQRLSFSFHDARGTSDSSYRVQYDARAIQHVAVDSFIPFLASILTLVSMIFVIVRIDLQLSLVALAVSPLLLLLAHGYRKRMRHRYKEAKQLESSAFNVIQETLSALRVVKAFGREEDSRDRFLDRSSEEVRAKIRLSWAEGTFAMLVSATTAIGTAAVLYIGVRNVQAGTLTLGELLIVISYLSQLYVPLKTIGRKVASLQNSLASADRAFEILDERPDVGDRKGALSLSHTRGNIKYEAVSFSYNNRQVALHDVTLDIPAGARVGIAGKTGAGKTTMVSLLMRFYDPSLGRILLDGMDIRDYKVADLRNQFAMVLQDPLLFSASIAENIAYARPGAGFGEIIAAAQAANAHGFIQRLPDGYSTTVGERGMRLSGGERQRISLARAFLKDAPILILDEPTSSVDVETEATIMEAMERLMSNRTTIMIAHRLSTLSDCDLRVEIDSGRVTDLLYNATERDRSIVYRSPPDRAGAGL